MAKLARKQKPDLGNKRDPETAEKPKKAPLKPPASLAACADLFYTIRIKRLKMQKLVDAEEEKEKFLAHHIIENLPREKERTGIAGKLVRVAVEKKTVPSVKDWDKFYAYIKKTGDFDLLQRKPSETAVKLRWEDNKTVPGVEKFTVKKLSVNAVKKGK